MGHRPGAAVLLVALVAGAPAMAAENLVEDILRARPDWFGALLDSAAAYELQVLYTQIDRDADNVPRFTEHPYRVDPGAYFYPASTVKLAAALLALERLNQLAVPGLDRTTPLRIDSALVGQTAVVADSTAPAGRPSIGHYIKKVFLVSDNDAYNRLYEFLGQQYLNEALWRKGYTDVRLTHRLSLPRTAAQNRATNPVSFYDPDNLDRVVYRQPLVINPRPLRAPGPVLKGKAHVRDGEVVPEPMDFAGKNAMSVPTLQRLLRAALFPDSLPERQRFELTAADHAFLARVMSMLPRESAQPRYDPGHYYDSYVKFFLFGDDQRPMPEPIRIFNKVGLAYGYMIDNAYVVDFEHGVEFMLTAVFTVNANQVYNDGEYLYDEVGFPLMARLGTAIYQFERHRQRRRRPDVSRFAIDYQE